MSRAHRFPARRLLFVSLVTAVLLRAFAWAQKAVLFDDGPLFLAMAKAISRPSSATPITPCIRSEWPSGRCSGSRRRRSRSRSAAPRRQQHAALRAAAEWIEAETLREGALATGRLRNAYYAGRRFEPLPAGSRALALARLRRRGVAYVLVAEKEIRHLPWLEPLDTSLRLVHRAEERGEAASVFEFIGSR